MICNYLNNPELFKRCLDLMEESFPGCKKYALGGIKYGAYWDKVSTPFVIEENSEVIAHAGIWPIKLILNGQQHTTACLHGICVKSDFRNNGHFKHLMQEITQYVTEYDSSIMFVTKPYLYKNYPYRMMVPEYDFALNNVNTYKTKPDPVKSDLRVLQPENKRDLTILHDLLVRRVPLSDQLGVMNSELFILNAQDKKIYYSEKLNTLIVYEIESIKNFLYLKEIISLQQQDIADIISSILNYEKNDVNEIIIQFYPDRFLKENQYSPILAGQRCCILASKNFFFKSAYFRYPELYWC